MRWEPIFSEFSVFLTLVVFTLFATACCRYSKKAGWHTLGMIGIGLGFTVLRCLLPAELPGAKVIRLEGFFTWVYSWLQQPLWSRGPAPGQVLLLVWAAGTVFLLLRLAVRLILQVRLARKTRIPEESRLYELYGEVLEQLGCGRKGALSASKRYATAMMAGFFHPDILLPENAGLLGDRQLRYVFRHEVMHYLHHDLWMKLFIELLCCLLWWNPAVYYLRSSAGQLLELQCDSSVCRGFAEEQKLEYSETLLEVFRGQARKTPFLAAGFLGRPGKERVKQRFTQILYAKKPSKGRWQLLAAFCCGALLFLGSYCTVFLPGGFPEEMREGDAKAASEITTVFVSTEEADSIPEGTKVGHSEIVWVERVKYNHKQRRLWSVTYQCWLTDGWECCCG